MNAAAIFCIGVLDGLERVCALILLLSEPLTSVAVSEVKILLRAVERFHEHGELVALRGEEVEFLGGGGVIHGFG